MNHSIDQETNICQRCGDSTTDLYFHSEGQYWCRDCEDGWEEVMIERWNAEQLNEDRLNKSIY